jgi:hypothetical protein
VVAPDHLEVGGVGVVGDAEVEQGHPRQAGVALLDEVVKPRGEVVTAGRPHPGLRARPGGMGGVDGLQQRVTVDRVERPPLINVVVVALLAVEGVAGGRVRAQRGPVDQPQPLTAGGPARLAVDQRPHRRPHHEVHELAVLVPGVLPGLRGVPHPPVRPLRGAL